MKKRTKVIIGVLAGAGCLGSLIAFCVIAAGLISAITGAGPSLPGKKLALIHVTGVITSGQGGSGFFGTTSGAERIVKQLEWARKDSSIKAIVIRINSPGGTAAGSQEIYGEIMKIRGDGKPVFASMGDVAASGGYYIASACNKIYANGSAMTGSIGVIMETSDMSALYKKIGIDVEVIKTGKFKDMGSSQRKLTPEERKIIRDMLDDTFKQFITAVSQGRRMPESEIRKLADGRVFTGRQALKLGLVDTLGGLEDAKLGAAREAGMRRVPKIVEYERSWLESVFGTTDERSMSPGYADGRLIRRLLEVAPEEAR